MLAYNDIMNTAMELIYLSLILFFKIIKHAQRENILERNSAALITRDH